MLRTHRPEVAALAVSAIVAVVLVGSFVAFGSSTAAEPAHATTADGAAVDQSTPAGVSGKKDGHDGDPSGTDSVTDEGRHIWQGDCAVCHGTRAQGSFQGPPIAESGTAAVDFMVRTGRMPRKLTTQKDSLPWARTERDSPRSTPKYSDAQIRALVEYTDTFISGPEVPDKVDLSNADLTNGGSLYRAQCASCHQLAGSGGSLAYGVVGPSLHQATPTEILEAIRTGPGSMPVYSPEVISHEQATDIAGYVKYLAAPEDRGGFALWHLGPVPEGLIAWVIGLGLILLMCRWLGKPAIDRD